MRVTVTASPSERAAPERAASERAVADKGDKGGIGTASPWASHPAFLGGTPSMPPWPLGRAAEGTPGSGRPKMLIMDVCGAYMRPVGGWFSVNGLVRLLSLLGVDEQATRSAVSRMRRRGLLEPETRDGVRGYRLTELSTAALPTAEDRIFAPVPSASLAEGWVYVAFSIPESDRDKRHLLRARLTWLNFGMVTNALWMAPRHRQDEVERSIAELGLERYVTVVVGHHRGFEDLDSLVRRCWDLDTLRELYRTHLADTTTALERWRGGVGERRWEAFVDYTLALHSWRKFPYLDPGLPSALLPRDWEGGRAAAAFFELRELLQGPALDHVREVGLTR